MIKKLIILTLAILMLTGCSKTVSYKYNKAESQNGDWAVENGRISIREDDDKIEFKVKYIGDTLIEKDEEWSCEVLVNKKNNKGSIEESETIFSRFDIYGKEMSKGDTKVVDTDNDVIEIDNGYDLSTVYLKIDYTKGTELCEDIIQVSVK